MNKLCEETETKALSPMQSIGEGISESMLVKRFDMISQLESSNIHIRRYLRDSLQTRKKVNCQLDQLKYS